MDAAVTVKYGYNQIFKLLKQRVCQKIEKHLSVYLCNSGAFFATQLSGKLKQEEHINHRYKETESWINDTKRKRHRGMGQGETLQELSNSIKYNQSGRVQKQEKHKELKSIKLK